MTTALVPQKPALIAPLGGPPGGDPMARGWGLERVVLPGGSIPAGATATVEWTAQRDTLLMEVRATATLGKQTKAIPVRAVGLLAYPSVESSGSPVFRVAAGTTMLFTVRNTGRKPWRVEVVLMLRAYVPPSAGHVGATGTWFSNTLHELSPLVAGNVHSYTLPVPAAVLTWEVLGFTPGKLTVDGLAYRIGDAWRRLELAALGFHAPPGQLAVRTPTLPAGTVLQAYTQTARSPYGWLRLTLAGQQAAPTGKTHGSPVGFLVGS